MEFSIYLEAVIVLGWMTFFALIILAVFWFVKSMIAKKNYRALQEVMLEQLKIGEEVTINDERHSYFSYHVIKIGVDTYYPVLKMSEKKIVVDHLVQKHCDRYLSEMVSGNKYETLCLQEKCQNIKGKM